MTPIDPTPYVAVYVIVVFLGPWLVFAWLLWREWSFVRSHGIVVTAQNWQTEWPRLKRFRAEDPRARYLHGLVTKWLRVTLVMWVVGFVILGSVLFLLARAGILLGPHSTRDGSRTWSNSTLERTAGSHTLAAAAQRERSAAGGCRWNLMNEQSARYTRPGSMPSTPAIWSACSL